MSAGSSKMSSSLESYREALLEKIVSNKLGKILEGQKEVSQPLKDERYSSDTKHRRWLAYWVATVVTVWLIAVYIALLATSSLSDAVLIALLTTTTANVLGLIWVVLRGLFIAEAKPIARHYRMR